MESDSGRIMGETTVEVEGQRWSGMKVKRKSRRTGQAGQDTAGQSNLGPGRAGGMQAQGTTGRYSIRYDTLYRPYDRIAYGRRIGGQDGLGLDWIRLDWSGLDWPSWCWLELGLVFATRAGGSIIGLLPCGATQTSAVWCLGGTGKGLGW